VITITIVAALLSMGEATAADEATQPTTSSAPFVMPRV
jgi:hypothetical protein